MFVFIIRVQLLMSNPAEAFTIQIRRVDVATVTAPALRSQ